MTLLREELEENWLRFVRGTFPRGFGTGRYQEEFAVRHGKKRRVMGRGTGFGDKSVKDELEFINLTEYYWNTYSIHVGLYSNAQAASGAIDAAWSDMESHEAKGTVFRDCYEDMQIISDWFKDSYGAVPYWEYSGGTGFHHMFGFPETEFNDPNKTLRLFYENMTSRLRLRTFELDEVGSLSKLVPLPFTHNVAYPERRLVTPIDPNWSIDRILAESRDNTLRRTVEIPQIDGALTDLLEIDEEFKSHQKFEGTLKANYRVARLRPCFDERTVRKTFEQIKATGQMELEYNLAVLWEYLRAGFPPKELDRLWKLWYGSDYRERESSYQIRYPARRVKDAEGNRVWTSKYPPKSCIKLFDEGFCQQDKCPLFVERVFPILKERALEPTPEEEI
jgi:hypothetical protein